MQFATLALAVVLPTAHFLDHHCPTFRVFDGFDRLSITRFDILRRYIPTIGKQCANPQGLREKRLLDTYAARMLDSMSAIY
jgi:hypothetical protein